MTGLAAQLDTLFARHEALRSGFTAYQARPGVRLLDAYSGLSVRHTT